MFRVAGLVILFAAMPLVLAQDALKSGPQVGSIIPGSFAPYNLNGAKKGHLHCLVCEHDLNPVVMIFAREPADGKDEALTELLQKVDETIAKNQKASLRGFIVFVSPDSRSSATGSKTDDPMKLVDEAIAREALEKRLSARAEKLKNVVVSHYPAPGPKGYSLSAKAETTVIFYDFHTVRANEAFVPGSLTSADVARIIQKVESRLGQGKKK